MERLLLDLRYGARTLLKSPAFTAVAIVTLALGIGATSAIFSVVNSVLLRPLAFPDSERIARVWTTTPDEPGARGVISYPNFKDLRERATAFEHMAAFARTTAVFGEGDEAEAVSGVAISADMLPTLGVRPRLGRDLAAEDDRVGADPVVLVSDGVWRRRFGADPNVVGTTIVMQSRATTVVGVLPPGFSFPVEAQSTDYVVPLEPIVADNVTRRGAQFLEVVGRVKPGVTMAQAGADANAVARGLAEQYPDEDEGMGARAIALHDDAVGDVRPALLVLLGAVALVLLIACANVANLMLARGAGREREMAIRAALGAGRGRLFAQLLSESLLLAAVGGGLGLLFAMWGTDVLASLTPADLPRVGEAGVDGRVLLFTAAVSLLTGVAAGVAPALQVSGSALADSLKEGGRGSTDGARRDRVRSALVVAEIAVSLVLLVGAGLLVKSLVRLGDVDAGFDAAGVAEMRVSVPKVKYPEPAAQGEFFRRAIERVAAAPGVEAVGAVDVLPLSNNSRFSSFSIEGRESRRPGGDESSEMTAVSPDYFRAMRIPVDRGRVFAATDAADAPRVVAVNEAFARKYFPGEDPVGKHIVTGAPPGVAPPSREIVGVVGDVRHAGMDLEPEPQFYVPYLQQPGRSMYIVVRGAVPGTAMSAAVRSAIREVDGAQFVPELQPMERLVSDSVAGRRFNALLLGLFAIVALALAAVGVYGVMAYTVTQRTHEIGVRMALGARPADVLRLVVGRGMAMALAGVAIGVIGALAASRVLAGLLFETSPTDPTTYATLALGLAGVALLACVVPARRATRVDPMVALRDR